ncbi:hypothetical protein [Alcanivorax sp.]|uniref:hypothetical protein n=1 Tax=Alcanivorax sp. TaxID=1872427 RepID=UPI000C111F71|nr:hypothetical protein [Alcanivorax sp.]PHR66988.1 MAG: hypothetical protein COA55_08485 [Alcanivorax sp.]
MLSSYVAIGVRLVAILFFFQAVREFFGVFQFFYQGSPYGDDTSVWPILVVALTSWALVFILWFSARVVGRLMASGGIDAKPEKMPPVSLLAVFVAAIGLFVFWYGAVDSLYYLSVIIMGKELGVSEMSVEIKANMVATAFEVISGIFLVMKARTVAGKINDVAR